MTRCVGCTFGPSVVADRIRLKPHPVLLVFSMPIFDVAGSLQMDVMRSVLEDVGIKQSEVAISSVLQCKPEEKPSFAVKQYPVINACIENGLALDIVEVNPKVIVALGNDVAQMLCNEKSIMKVNGQIRDLAGFTVVLSVSPEYVLVSKDADVAMSMLRSTFRVVSDVLRDTVAQKRRKLYHAITDCNQFNEVLDQLSGVGPYVIDYENYPLKPWYKDSVILSVSITDRADEAWGILVDHPDAKWTSRERVFIQRRLARWCASNVPKVAANAKHEILWTRECLGVELVNVVGDPIALDYLEDENRPHDVGTMAWRYIESMGGYDRVMEEYWYKNDKGDKKPDYRKAPGSVLLQYNMQDVDVEWFVYDLLRKRMDAKLLAVHDDILIPAAYTLASVESSGWCVDEKRVAKLTVEHDKKANDALQKLRSYEVFKRFETDQGEPFNFDSSQQRARFFYGWNNKAKMKNVDPSKRYLDMPINYDYLTEAGQPSTDKYWRAAHLVSHPLIADYDAYLNLHTLKKNFLTPLPEYLDNKNRCIHTDYNANKVVSGRLSSIDPNTQNWPDDESFWSIFVSRFKRGVFIKADYSQVELRVLACLAWDKTMIRTFNQHEDIHVNTAREFMEIGIEQWEAMTDEQRHEYRQMGKRFNFGVANNRGAHHLALDLTAWQRKAHPDQDITVTDEQAQVYLDTWYRKHSSIKLWKRKEIAKAEKLGYVQSPFGYRRRADLKTKDKVARAAAERVLISFLMQNTAAIITLKAMTKIRLTLAGVKADTLIVGSCYDSIYFDAPSDEATDVARLVRDLMMGIGKESEMKMTFPLEVEVALGLNGGALEVLED